jgi:cytochrome b561
MQNVTGYSKLQIALHWAVALLVAGQYVFKDAISGAWSAVMEGRQYAFDPMILAHVASGVLILFFVLWRLRLRMTRGAPLPPENEPAPLKAISHIAHWAFYGILVAMSVTGLLAWFGGITAAALPHNILKVALLALVAMHVLAIPFHRIVLKNNVMQRMIRPTH